MRSRLAVPAGMLAGLLVAATVIAGVALYTPGVGLLGSPSPAPRAGESPSPPIATASNGPAGSVAPSPDSATELFHVGEAAPVLVVPRLGGGTVDLAALKGRPVWLVFMATWCPSCVDELPHMSGFAARYEGAGLLVLAVDMREDEDTVRSYVDSLGVIFPVGLDSDGTAAREWDVLVPPIHFWIDREGTVRHGALGGIGPDLMAAGLQTILPGVAVTP